MRLPMVIRVRSLTELSLRDSLHSVFKYAPTQGDLVIKSKRNPLFSTVSVCEALKAPEKWRANSLWGSSLHRSLEL